MYGGQSTYIPLKVNQAGVIPIIFASSVLYLPLLITQRAARPTAGATGVQEFVDDNLAAARRRSSTSSIYGVLIIGFAYFYTAITFDPAQQADTDPQAGRVHPRHPARPPDRALPRQDPVPHHAARARCSSPCIALLPVAAARPSPTCENFPFAGTSILIAVGVALETMKQIDSQLMMRNYEGFLK